MRALITALKVALTIVIFVVDLALKLALGYALMLLLWLPFGWLGDVRFGLGWRIASLIVGVCIIGLYEGCDIILMGLAKQVWERER